MRLSPFCQLASAFLLLLTLFPASGQIPNEHLEHTSTLGIKFVSVPGTPALISTHETRISDWQAFLTASGYSWSYKPHFEQGPDHPVVGITLEDARAFCTWLTEKERAEGKLNSAQSYRLPNRNDWDSAAGLLRTRKPDLTVEEKVTDERVHLWGLSWPPPKKVGNFAEDEIPGYEDGFPFTAPVGQYPPTAEGIHDLAGNVWEWSWDPEIRAEQVGVLRGGSWAYFRQESLRSAYLYTVPVDLRMSTVGFRCVYEDKQRTATMLAAAEKVKAEIRTQRREEIMGGDVNKEELAAMKAKLASGTPTPAAESVTLTPVEAGKPFTNRLGMEFVPLPGKSLFFGKHEVRAQDYEAWLNETGRTWEKKPPFLATGEHPAVGVSWENATAFCVWLTTYDRSNSLIPEGASYRLPTDAEWSLAAGLNDEKGDNPEAKHLNATSHYPWSAEGQFPPPPNTTNLDANRIPGYRDSFSYTAPVNSESANALNILGLGGNASEWCQDVWPSAADERVVRGGSWLSNDRELLRTGNRQHFRSSVNNNGIGFRPVLELPAP